MAAVAADDDQVAVMLLGKTVNFLSGLAIGQLAIFFCELRIDIDQPIKALFGLIKLLLLQL